MRGVGRALVASLLLGSVAAPAAAQGTGSAIRAAATARATAGMQGDAAELNEQGLAFYAARDYRHALEKFIGAQALESDPSLLFNIARCYEQLGELEAALEKYQLFVAKVGGDAAGTKRARASMDAIEQALRSSSPPTTKSASQTARAPDEQPPGAADWHWLALGGSAAFVAVGVTFYALGSRDHARVSELPEFGQTGVPAKMTWRQAHALVDSGDTKKLVGGISLGLGGALAASALALFLSADRAAPPEAQLAVQPSLLRGGGALLLAGRFP